MKIINLSATLGFGFVAACTHTMPQGTPDRHAAAVSPVGVAVQSAALESGAPVNAAFLRIATGDVYVLVAAGIEGVEILSPDGVRVGMLSGIEAGMLAVVPDVRLEGGTSPLVLVYDASASSISAYRLDGEAALRPVMAKPIKVRDEVTGLCHHRSLLSGSDYLYAVTDGGLIHQFELYSAAGGVQARLLRTLPSGKGSGFCAADPRDGLLYVSEESIGVWRLGAEPESDTTREPVDLRAPFGNLGEDIKGIAIYPADPDTSYLVVADLENERLVIYRLPDIELVSAISVDGLGEPEGLAATTAPAGPQFPAGALAVADESTGSGGPNIKLIGWDALASVTGVSLASPTTVLARPPVVRPIRETDVMPSYGDAADDPAIWVHPENPELSIVIGTNKQAGLHVYDLEGRTLQMLADGKMNNVDLRAGFPLGGDHVTLVTASNRTSDSIAAYRVDPDMRRLVDVAAGVLATGFDDPYGLCMYRSAASGEYYAFVNEGGVGTYRQFRLYASGAGRVATKLVRQFDVGSQAEGCVADDENGTLYVAEEDVGLWKYLAEPDAGDGRTLVDNTAGGRLTDDVEGVTLWIGADGGGYIVVSNQGEDNYAVYRRDGNNDYIGTFHVVANPAAGIDGASETDGLDLTSAALGPDYPDGLLVVQDGRNIAPEEPQNFKYVSWADVVRALELD